jgi:hypothetical protein
MTSLMTGNGSRETIKKIHTDLAIVQLLSAVVTQKVTSHKSFPICSLTFHRGEKSYYLLTHLSDIHSPLFMSANHWQFLWGEMFLYLGWVLLSPYPQILLKTINCKKKIMCKPIMFFLELYYVPLDSIKIPSP